MIEEDQVKKLNTIFCNAVERLLEFYGCNAATCSEFAIQENYRSTTVYKNGDWCGAVRLVKNGSELKVMVSYANPPVSAPVAKAATWEAKL